MISALLEIQNTVMKYVEIISKVSQVDVEVVDENLFRVAGTGMFKEDINKDMSSEAYVYKNIMRTGNTEIIYNPGHEKLCIECPKKDTCKEEIEISMPLKQGGEIIGAIGLVGSTKEQKDIILSNQKMYIELLSQIAEFIVVKATEVGEMKKRTVLLETLDCVINHVEKGIIILGNDDVITMANESAKKQLVIDMPEGCMVNIKTTGDKLNNQNEYIMTINKKEHSVIGHMYDLKDKPKRYSKVLIFESIKDVQEKYYEMTSTINPLNSLNIIGVSPQTLQMKNDIKKIAKSTSTVLITGESGTGKEMVATAIWKESDRCNNRFIAINCGAIPEPLLESELFGYVKGAFTGADPNGRMGKFELANKGVIFLDEIGDMPLYLQVKILRVLQERKIVRIGSNQVIPLDVRVIAATNKDLKEMINKNKFREDLYYRLNVIPFKIAPLRERREDIRELVYFFADRYAKLFKKRLWRISEDVMECLNNYPWYGNVREIENVVEFMINMMDEDGVIGMNTLPDNFFKTETKISDKSLVLEKDRVRDLKTLEREEIFKAISIYGADTEGKKKAAKKLGIGLATLYRKMECCSQNDNN